MTAEEAASWMYAELQRFGALQQDDAASSLPADWTYENDAGNLAIRSEVLKAFNRITGNDIVWERSAKLWRPRDKDDLPGRMQP